MFQRFPLLALLCGVVSGSGAQTMTFAGGGLSVSPGTTLELAGPISWQLAGDAQVVNDGHIELGDEGTLMETLGAPITGAGTETATWQALGPLVGAEPGGLGLTINSSYAAGGMRVERGHSQIIGPNAASSIARWFHTSTPVANTADMDVVLRYDPTELNGILPALLSLFVSSDITGPWTSIATNGNEPAFELTGTEQPSADRITAFDFDAATHAAANSPDHEPRIWPTLFTEVIMVRMPDGAVLEQAELIDAAGRKTEILLGSSVTEGLVVLPVPELPSGAYLLRLNGSRSAYHLMHQ